MTTGWIDTLLRRLRGAGPAGTAAPVALPVPVSVPASGTPPAPLKSPAPAPVPTPARAPLQRQHAPAPSSGPVPIRTLGSRHRERIAAHLLALDARDRYLRFGYMASDEQIRRYVDGLDFQRDEIFGIYNRGLRLIAMAHLAYSTDPQSQACAEFGVSVAASARGRGYGARLFDRAATHARNEGVVLLFIHALSENAAMLRIARKAGATLERDGSETEAYLRLPAATFDSRLNEMVEERFAQTNYRLKVEARRFLGFLAQLQEVRRGVQEGRHRSGQ